MGSGRRRGTHAIAMEVVRRQRVPMITRFAANGVCMVLQNTAHIQINGVPRVTAELADPMS